MRDTLVYKIVRPLIKAFTMFVFHPKFIGIEHIPKSGAFILAGNHTNNLDCIVLISSTKRTIHFLAKDSLMKGPKRIIFKSMGIIPVNRRIHDKNALNLGKKTLENGGVVAVFPEGTINKTSSAILPFKIGAVKMSYDTKTPIVPFIIRGKYNPFKSDLTVEFLEPFKVSDNLTNENEKFMSLVESLLKG